MQKGIWLPVLPVLLLAAACTGKEPPPAPAPAADTEAAGTPGPAWPALALLETGENPLWFELGPAGPSLIDSPAAASLTPFVPWPYARFVAGFMAWNGFLVMAINRDGFLVIGAAADAAGGNAKTENTGAENAKVFLYRAAGGALWDSYTTESFFPWNDKPAVLLYRDDFFADPTAPSPRPQVYVLDTFSSVPLGAAVPALECFPSNGPWEAEVVRRGPDGLWYYRMKEKGEAQNEIAYFCTSNLKEPGEKISVGEWRDSDLPEGPENAPPFLAALVTKIQAQGGIGQGRAGTARAFVVKTVSPDFASPRLFSSRKVSAPGESENFDLLFGYCRENPEPLALAVQSNGQGFYLRGTEQDLKPFSLPSLPAGFVYTGVALLGDVLAASWEEQQEASIGAAGVMIVNPNLSQSLSQD